MAMEYFDDKIAPGLLRKHHNITSTSSATVSSMMTMTSSVLMTPASVSSALFSSPITTSTPISRGSRFRDELLTHKKQTMEMVVRQTQKHVKKAVNRVSIIPMQCNININFKIENLVLAQWFYFRPCKDNEKKLIN